MPSNQLPEDVREKARHAAHLAVEDVLVEMRDARMFIMPWANGLVIREKDGEESGIVRLTTGDAMRIAVDAIAPLIIEWARKDQAEVDASKADHEGHLWSGAPAMAFFKLADAIRAQFAGETGGQ